MPEVLSQSQIDALISSMASGNVEPESKTEEKKYKKYDFNSPKKFTKDKLKLLFGIYEDYGKLCASRINSIVREASQVDVMAVEEQRYFEFSNALSENDVLTLINVSMNQGAHNGTIVLHITNQLMISIIDRMIGGTGDDLSEVDASYVYTDIELSLYKSIVKYFVEIMGDSWLNYYKLDFALEKIETNPSMMQKIGKDETIVIVVIDVEITGVKGKINICLPGNFLGAMFASMEQKPERNTMEEESAITIFDNIKSTSMEIKAELGSSILSLKDLYSLHVGDVINLNKPKDSDLYLYVEGEPWFKGAFGKSNKNMAIKINQTMEKNRIIKGE